MSSFLDTKKKKTTIKPVKHTEATSQKVTSETKGESGNQVSRSKQKSSITNGNKLVSFPVDARWIPVAAIAEHEVFGNPRGNKFPFTFEMFSGAPKIFEFPGFSRVISDGGIVSVSDMPPGYEVVGDFMDRNSEDSYDFDIYINQLYSYLNTNFPEMEGSEIVIKSELVKLVADALTIRTIDKLEQPIKLVDKGDRESFICKEGARRTCMHILMGHSHILSYVGIESVTDGIEWLKGQLRADQKDKLTESQLCLALWRLKKSYLEQGLAFDVDVITRNTRLNQRTAYAYNVAVRACELFENAMTNHVQQALEDGVLKIRHFASSGDVRFPIKDMKAGDKDAVVDFISGLYGEKSVSKSKPQKVASKDKARLKRVNKMLQLSPKNNSNDFMNWMVSEIVKSHPEYEELLPEKDQRHTADGLLDSIEAIYRARRGY